MGSIFDAIRTVWNQISYAISGFRFPYDLIDILIIAFILFKAIAFLRESRSGQLVKGLVILFAVYIIATWWKLATLKWLLSIVMDSIIVIAVVVFQPEIRRVLEKVGRTKFSKGQLFDSEENEVAQCIDSVSKASGIMQEKRIGALIVFERTTQLGEIISTGTLIDAKASVSVINNIFFPKSPLHDGAMIIRNGRVLAAGCILPLTQREDLSLQLGTRHRAAIGMTENSDAVVLVVSEETGNISIAMNGQIKRDYNAVSAGAELRRLLTDEQGEDKSGTISAVISKFIHVKKPNTEEGEGEKK